MAKIDDLWYKRGQKDAKAGKPMYTTPPPTVYAVSYEDGYRDAMRTKAAKKNPSLAVGIPVGKFLPARLNANGTVTFKVPKKVAKKRTAPKKKAKKATKRKR